ncbi:MAG: hypothetical protein J6C46_11300 [Clostridia bacterium]|nr:hypothetical protein [Clostridia bacterium]
MVSVTRLFEKETDADFILVKIFERNFIVNRNKPSQKILVKDSKRAPDDMYKTNNPKVFIYSFYNMLFKFENISDYHIINFSSTHKIFLLLSDNVVYFYEIFCPVSDTNPVINYIDSIHVSHLYYMFTVSYDLALDVSSVEKHSFSKEFKNSLTYMRENSHSLCIFPKIKDEFINSFASCINASPTLFWLNATDGFYSLLTSYHLPNGKTVKSIFRAPFEFLEVYNGLINKKDGKFYDTTKLNEWIEKDEKIKAAIKTPYNFFFNYSPFGLLLTIHLEKSNEDSTYNVIMFELSNKTNAFCDENANSKDNIYSNSENGLIIRKAVIHSFNNTPHVFIEEKDGQKVYKMYYYSTHMNNLLWEFSDEEPIIIKNPRNGLEYVFLKSKDWRKTKESKNVMIVLNSTLNLVEVYEDVTLDNISEDGINFNDDFVVGDQKYFKLNKDGFFVIEQVISFTKKYLFVSASHESQVAIDRNFVNYHSCKDNGVLVFFVTKKEEKETLVDCIFNPRTSSTIPFDERFSTLLKTVIEKEKFIKI